MADQVGVFVQLAIDHTCLSAPIATNSNIPTIISGFDFIRFCECFLDLFFTDLALPHALASVTVVDDPHTQKLLTNEP
jgi:hypothetical protein